MPGAWSNCYSEADQPSSSFVNRTLVLGGTHGAGTSGYGGQISGNGGQLYAAQDLIVARNLQVNGSNTSMGPQSGTASDNTFFFDNTNFSTFLYGRSWAAGVPQTDGLIIFHRGFGIDLNAVQPGTRVALQVQSADIATAQADGLHVNGLVAATAGFTSSGATNGIGYASGAGGAVAQTTNKSSGVTFNKASGQVTMHNASLAAGAIVSFTITNNVVAATDTVNLNLASGNAAAGTYRYWVEGLAAGSFRIAVENRSGGALAEALVFNFAVLKAVNA
jgi:hypothetical protein